MSCKICGRGACASWMHSAAQQEAWELVEAMDDRQLKFAVVDLRNDVSTLKVEIADDAIALRDIMRERDAAVAELAAERARLDSGTILLIVAGERVWACGVDLRAAIDAGMKEGAK